MNQRSGWVAMKPLCGLGLAGYLRFPIRCAYNVCMNTNHITSKVTHADCPEDGGKWAIYCEHFDSTGEIIGTGLVQDTNKRRLASWEKHSIDWCCYCQEEAQQ